MQLHRRAEAVERKRKQRNHDVVGVAFDSGTAARLTAFGEMMGWGRRARSRVVRLAVEAYLARVLPTAGERGGVAAAT
jgi:hypothetical protein